MLSITFWKTRRMRLEELGYPKGWGRRNVAYNWGFPPTASRAQVSDVLNRCLGSSETGKEAKRTISVKIEHFGSYFIEWREHNSGGIQTIRDTFLAHFWPLMWYFNHKITALLLKTFKVSIVHEVERKPSFKSYFSLKLNSLISKAKKKTMFNFV